MNTISVNEWEERMQTLVPYKEDLNKLVMNFLILEGYKEGALKF